MWQHKCDNSDVATEMWQQKCDNSDVATESKRKCGNNNTGIKKYGNRMYATKMKQQKCTRRTIKVL